MTVTAGALRRHEEAQTMIVSVHIPKCGGTSFRAILEGIFGKSLWLNYGQVFSAGQAAPGAIPRGIQCVHGHFIADALDGLAPETRKVTWLRHPVERVVSNYFHCLRGPDFRDGCCRELYDRKLSLEGFAELDWMRNLQKRYLGGKGLEEFDVVGIMERYEQSLSVFGDVFGLPVPGEAPRDNVNPERETDTYRISRGTYDHILSLNHEDLAIYYAAQARLDREVARLRGGRLSAAAA